MLQGHKYKHIIYFATELQTLRQSATACLAYRSKCRCCCSLGSGPGGCAGQQAHAGSWGPSGHSPPPGCLGYQAEGVQPWLWLGRTAPGVQEGKRKHNWLFRGDICSFGEWVSVVSFIQGGVCVPPLFSVFSERLVIQTILSQRLNAVLPEISILNLMLWGHFVPTMG